MATPKLALIPTGYKAGKLYSVLPESGVGDFTVVRATEATRVNEDGLIETMGANVPRLDYSAGGCPVLLTEPQSTNLVTYSNDFSDAYWTKSRASITNNSLISPDGTLNASKFTQTTSTAWGGVVLTITPSGNSTLSIFAKKIDNDYIAIIGHNSNDTKVYFNLDNGTIGTVGADVTNADIQDYGNGWYRCVLIASSINRFTVLHSTTDNGNTANLNTETSLWGAMLEQGSYPSSYIKTEGSAVTRNADQVYGSGDAATFNDSEGVLMAEISALNNTVSTYNSIGLGSGSSNNRMGLGFEAPSNIYVYKQSGSGWLPTKTVDITLLNKVALSYNTNDNHFWLNGFKLASNTTIGDIGQPTELEFEASYGAEEFYGKTSQVQYFNTALTDSELETLTSWTSFIEMAQAQNYNII